MTIIETPSCVVSLADRAGPEHRTTSCKRTSLPFSYSTRAVREVPGSFLSTVSAPSVSDFRRSLVSSTLSSEFWVDTYVPVLCRLVLCLNFGVAASRPATDRTVLACSAFHRERFCSAPYRPLHATARFTLKTQRIPSAYPERRDSHGCVLRDARVDARARVRPRGRRGRASGRNASRNR